MSKVTERMATKRGSYGQLFWKRVEKYPPILCRLLARVPRGRPLSTEEIAERGGLSPVMVEAISMQTDWSGIDLPTARKFMIGCGTDLSSSRDCRRIVAYLRSAPKDPRKRFPYLKKSDRWATLYLPLLELFVAYVKHKRQK